MENLTTAAAAVHTAIPAQTERPSNVAMRAVVRSSPTRAEKRIGGLLAQWAFRVRPEDARRLKAPVGAVVTVGYQRTMGAALNNMHVKSVCRALRGLREQGAFKVVQTGRTGRTYIWNADAASVTAAVTAEVTSGVTADEFHVRVPHADPQRDRGTRSGRRTGGERREQRTRVGRRPDRASEKQVRMLLALERQHCLWPDEPRIRALSAAEASRRIAALEAVERRRNGPLMAGRDVRPGVDLVTQPDGTSGRAA